MPGVERFGAVRPAVPFLGEVLARGGLVPDEPLHAALDVADLDCVRHVVDHVEQLFELVVVLAVSDTPFVAARSLPQPIGRIDVRFPGSDAGRVGGAPRRAGWSGSISECPSENVLRDLKNEATKFKAKYSIAIIAADVKRLGHKINADDVFGTHRSNAEPCGS
jgi:hypothetical protein